MVAEDIPSDTELNRLYEKDYFFGKEYHDYKADRKALEKNFQSRLKKLYKPLDPTSKVIEIGCAYGYFLNLIKDEVGYHQGFDVSIDGVDYAKAQLGINATTDNFLDANIAPGSIDAVFMWDVIEHLSKPEQFVSKAAKILKPGASLTLTTGDISSLMARVRGNKWRMIHPPTHIYYFDPKSITRLLGRMGLTIERISYMPTYRNLGSVINQLVYNRKAKQQKPFALEQISRVLANSGAGNLNFPLNTRDIMEVVALKQA